MVEIKNKFNIIAFLFQVNSICLFVWMGLNATFNNMSVISWQSILLVEEARVPGENHRPWAGNWQTLSHAMQVERNPFLYGTNPGANSRHIGARLQWSVQVSLNQLPRPLGHPGPNCEVNSKKNLLTNKKAKYIGLDCLK